MPKTRGFSLDHLYAKPKATPRTSYADTAQGRLSAKLGILVGEGDVRIADRASMEPFYDKLEAALGLGAEAEDAAFSRKLAQARAGKLPEDHPFWKQLEARWDQLEQAQPTSEDPLASWEAKASQAPVDGGEVASDFTAKEAATDSSQQLGALGIHGLRISDDK